MGWKAAVRPPSRKRPVLQSNIIFWDLDTRVNSQRHDPRPTSAVSAGTGYAGLAGLLAWVLAARAYAMSGPLAALTALLACGVPMVLWSLIVDKVHRSPSTGIDWCCRLRPLSETLDISLVKLGGLFATWGAIAGFYAVGRWYWDGQYQFAMQVLTWALVPLAMVAIPYVIWLDRRLIEPRDNAWHFGQILVGGEADTERVREHLRQWVIKGFYLAFMLSIVPGNWNDAISWPAWEIVHSPVNLAVYLVGTMFMIDVTFATVGYLLTMKPLDAHIRSANPFAAGWTAALICYPPFVLMGMGGPLDYQHNDRAWIYWLEGQPIASSVIGFLLVALTAIYAWATVAFGIRFSNLTHRGILTHGPYAITKHPAYVSKTLFWWLASMPFLATSGSFADAVRNGAIFLAVTGVYYWRARTEERHLRQDAAYREYAAWMERNGPLPRLIAWAKEKTTRAVTSGRGASNRGHR